MGLFFVYVDETGYTEQLSKIPKQGNHLFEFGAAFVRADDGTQLEVERQLTVLQHEISKEMGRERTIKLHATDLYHGTKDYREASSEKRNEWFQGVLKIGLQPKGVFYDSYLLNAKFHAELHQETIRNTQLPPSNSQRLEGQFKNFLKQYNKITMYEKSFLEFLLYCDKRLDQLNHFGLLIFDQRAESKKFVPSNIYHFLRAAGFLKRILEVPIFAEARYHPLLALADFTVYVRQGVRKDDLSGKNRPKFEEWSQNYVAPLMLDKMRFLHGEDDQHRNLILTYLYGFCLPHKTSHNPALDINALYPVLRQTQHKEQVLSEVFRLLEQKYF